MLLLKTTFHLRNDLKWSTIYEECIYQWINNSEDKRTRKKNYAGLLKVLPHKVNFDDKTEDTFSFANDSLSYSMFSFKGDDYLGFNFLYSDCNRKWNVRIVFKRNSKYVYCCVSVSCEGEQGARIPTISKPRIIDYLLRLQDGVGDGGIEIKKEPHFLEDADLPMAINILKGKGNNKLPIIYLSCYERHALRPMEVAKKLYGIAHVYAERDKKFADSISMKIKGHFPRGGEIAICYPSQTPIIINRHDDKTWQNKPEVLTQDIFKQILRQNIATKAEFSWDDYQKAYTEYLRKVAERVRKSTENSQEAIDVLKAKYEEDIQRIEKQHAETIKKYQKDFDEKESLQAMLDEEVSDLRESVRNLKSQLNDALDAKEAMGNNLKELKQKSGPQFALFVPKECEKYENEYQNHIICAIKIAMRKEVGKNSSNSQRNLDVWQAILDANQAAVKDYEQYCNKKKEIVALAKMEALKSPKAGDLLKYFGLTTSKKRKNHIDICFENDDRYKATESSSGSDSAHGGGNEASAFERAFFCSHK